MTTQEVNFSFSPYLSGESVKEVDRKILNEQFLEINMLAIPLRVAGKGIDKACHSNQVMEKVCHIAAYTLMTFYEIIPESIRSAAETKKHLIEERIVLHNHEAYGIPPEETRYALESLLLTAPGSGTMMGGIFKLSGNLIKRVVQIVKPQRVIDPIRRTEKAFQKGWKKFKGELSQDLRLVQFRGEGNSLRWWTTIEEANRFFTMEDASRRLALLSKFGERTHVSIAVVPKGTKTQFFSGKARYQADIGKLEFLKGGGKQFYFHDFNPNWVRETRSLPYEIRRVRSLNNPVNTIIKLPKLMGSRPLARLPGKEKKERPFIEEEGALNSVVLERIGKDSLSLSETSSEKHVDEQPASDLTFEIHSNAVMLKKKISDDVTVGAQVVLLSPKSSTLLASCKISDAVTAGVIFCPAEPRQVQITVNTDKCGVSIPLAHPKYSSINIPLGANQSASASIAVCPGDPLQSSLSGRVTVPINGVSVTFSGSITLKHPENATLGVSLPTIGLDKVIPGLPKEVQVISADLKKIRHQVRSIAHKIGICSKRRKKRKKIRARNNAFALAATKNEDLEKKIEAQFENWLREVPNIVTSAVEEKYTPILMEEFSVLSKELRSFQEKLADLKKFEFPLSSREILQLDCQSLMWDMVNWLEFVQSARKVSTELHGLTEAIDEVEPAMRKLFSTLERSETQAEKITEKYKELEPIYQETERISDDLIASKDVIASFLSKRIPKEAIQQIKKNLTHN